MRKSLLAGACAVAISGAASAQFASDRNPPTAPFGGGTLPATPKAAPAGGVPQLPGGITPAGGGAPAPTGPSLPGGFVLPDPVRREPLRPVPTTIDEKAPPHKWAVKADDGPWMILVKSYAGPDSKAKAEAFAKDIRETHNTKSLLYERNAEERKAEQERIEAIRKAEQERAAPFKQAVEQARKEAEATGSIFVESKATVKVPRPYHEAPEQWAVLIGGFKTADDARAAVAVVKKLPIPKDTALLDVALVGGDTNSKEEKGEWKSNYAYINPYASAMVVPNPATATLNLEEKAKLEPFVVKLNEGVENSLLKAKKPWTLLVKSYSAPSIRGAGDGEEKSVFDRVKKSFTSDPADILRATAAEAELLAKALRNPDMKPRTYEAFVLHHRVGSIVTVGQFDAPDDPELLKLQQELLGIAFEMRDKDKKPVLGPDGKPLVQKLFDGVSLFPVPKY